MIHNEGQTFAPEVKFVWDGVSFGIAIGIWAIIITVVGTAVGVLLAERTAWWLALYAVVALAGHVLLPLGSAEKERDRRDQEGHRRLVVRPVPPTQPPKRHRRSPRRWSSSPGNARPLEPDDGETYLRALPLNFPGAYHRAVPIP